MTLLNLGERKERGGFMYVRGVTGFGQGRARKPRRQKKPSTSARKEAVAARHTWRERFNRRVRYKALAAPNAR